MRDEILRYDHVDVSYSGAKAVRDVSFTLYQGEILGIAGESGSGKSTLIKAAMGLLGPSGKVSAGKITYQEKNLAELTDRQQRKLNGSDLGMIFQNAGSSFCPVRTIGEQMLESLREKDDITKEAFHARAITLLETIGFADPVRVLNSYPFELSGGMAQRAGIAAAMIPGPKILFADEPTSALDVSVQKQVVKEMRLLREKFGTSIVLVTHNIGVIEAIADRVLIMKDGAIAEEGGTKEVLYSPRGAYTKRLMAAVPRLRKNV